jgi:hypothetical protein
MLDFCIFVDYYFIIYTYADFKSKRSLLWNISALIAGVLRRITARVTAAF